LSKLERLYRTSESSKLSNLVLLADGLLSISAEYGCEASGELRDSEVFVYYRNCSVGEDLFELEELEERGLEIHLIDGFGGKDAGSLLEEAREPAVRVLNELRQYAPLTYMTGTEYALLVLRTGEVYIAEGGFGKVVLPYIKEVILEAHTHPGTCLPSARDCSEIAAGFMDGLYAGGIISMGCTLLVYRVGPLMEEDVETLMRLHQVLGENPTFSQVKLGSIRVEILIP
jgi:hypothetical protein